MAADNIFFDKNKGLELLAPAGSFEVFKAVLMAGADAVYLGGTRFGARAYAGNLSDCELLEAVDYAHIHGRKLYLTVNTLIKNSEIKELYDYIAPLYEAGLDAVIVQDYGVMKLINDFFPGLSIHASTQMTVTHPSYIDFLKKYNVTRIVPARELSLDEVAALRMRDRDMELECFIHGALCYSYSGQCLMSSFLGGRSGNRGRCAGTCRLMYGDSGRQRCLLSLKDLCTLEILPDILEAGVYSLKLEGRMKSVEYAAGVTSIYRKYADMYLQGGRGGYRVDSDDIRRLLMLFDRGGMTNGYYFRHNGADMIADSVKSDKSQAEKSEYENFIKDRFAGKNLKEKVSAFVKLVSGEKAVLRLSDGMHNNIVVTGDEVLNALNSPLSASDIKKQLCRLGNTGYEIQNIEINAGDNIFLPNRSLNDLRREAVKALDDARLSPFKRSSCAKPFSVVSDSNPRKCAVRRRISVRATTLEQAHAALDSGIDRICLETEIMDFGELKQMREKCAGLSVECFLAMPRIMRKSKWSFIENNLENIKKSDFDGFLIRNMAEYEYMRGKGFEGRFTADYPVYAFNDFAVKVLSDSGFDGMTYPIELNERELFGLGRAFEKEKELIVYMRMPLMISANCIDSTLGGCHKPHSGNGKFKDRKNAVFRYMSCCRFCYNVIYNSVPTVLTDRTDEISELEPDYLVLAFCDESGEEAAGAVLAAKNGQKIDFVPEGKFTRGHFGRGVE